ncbi:cell division protein FtsA [Patescibacteria group bacterium]|nr:cell division protein FtsA [Patescibacteria group bacterium]MBU4579867.1 cell division protein FtsA [Patescibacteria group bacterium]
MSRSNIIAGLDIGTSAIRIVVAEQSSGSKKPIITGVSAIPSSGLRKGIIVDLEGVAADISNCLEQAERASGVQINRIVSTINGEHISLQKSKSVIAVSRVDNEISQEDVNRAIDTAQAVSLSPNKAIIHVIPTSYIVDNEKNIKDPVGMHGMKLEANVLIVSGNYSFIKNLIKAINQSGLEVAEKSFILAPLAAARSVLGKRQKELGVVLIDIGAETTGIAVYEEGALLHTKIISIGGSHITNDIAIGLRIAIDAAEKIKRDFGYAVASDVSKKDKINLKDYDPQTDDVYISRNYLAEIIEARLEEIFEHVNKELKYIGKDGMLPEGAVLTGGGIKIPGTIDLAKKVLRLPVKIGAINDLGGIIDKISDPSFATVTGVVLWQMDQGDSEEPPIIEMIKNIFKKTVSLFKNFLP